MKLHLQRFVAAALLAMLVTSCACPFAKRNNDTVNLLNPDLLYSYMKEFGVDNDPDKVFQWKNGQLLISGQYYGYLATKNEYSNYVLIAEYKYGEKTWPPREDKARDSGILCHFVGRDQIWPKALEAQIIEGGSGDILVVSGAKLTIDGVTKGPRTERFDRPGRNPWKDEKGFRGPNEI
ncbi:MAG: family 16 glycoside hydrolase, partial [Limisphaerales bacterium]